MLETVFHLTGQLRRESPGGRKGQRGMVMTSTTSVYHGYNIPGIVSYLRYFISPSQKPPTIYY